MTSWSSILARAPRWLRWLIPVVSTAFLYGLVYLAAWQFFDVKIVPRRAAADFTLELALGFVLFALARRVWPFLLLQALLLGSLYIGSAMKIAVLGRPIMPDDVDAVGALIEILGPAGWFAVALPLALMIGLLLGNLRFRGTAPKVALGALGLFAISVAALPAPIGRALDARFGNTEWDQRENYVWRGAGIHLLQETARLLGQRRPPPGPVEALAAAERQLAGPREASLRLGGVPRNIHVLLQESFWDPSLLQNAEFSEPPLDPRFRALWREAGYSWALSPAFGGQTANAEFEFLCGFPVHEHGVLFERGFRNDLPCLPRVLGDFGYRTVASHPNVAGFWNRTNAYRHVGFETYWSVSDFELDDLNGPFLADRSLYRQVGAKLAAQSDGRPVLDYIMTFYGHWAYDMSERRPKAIDSASSVPEVENYANVVRYKSAELMDEIEQLRAADPNSIIVVFGDHLPSLGSNFAGYVESGLLASSFGDFTPAMYQLSAGTPLIVIDGRRGPLQLGRVPLFELPRLVLDLIGYDRLTMFDFATPPGDMMLRPLPGATLSFIDGEIDMVCRRGSSAPDCRRAEAWLADVDLLARDLFTGEAHALAALARPDTERPTLPEPAAKPPYVEVELKPAAPGAYRDHRYLAEHGVASPPQP